MVEKDPSRCEAAIAGAWGCRRQCAFLRRVDVDVVEVGFSPSPRRLQPRLCNTHRRVLERGGGVHVITGSYDPSPILGGWTTTYVRRVTEEDNRR